MAPKKRKSTPSGTSSSKAIPIDYDMRDYAWTQKMKDCPIYRPTIDEFKDPFKFIQSIATEASEFGICKIKPPLVACTPATMVLGKDFKFKTTIQLLQANNGQIQHTYDEGRMRRLEDYEVLANKMVSERYGGSSAIHSLEFLEMEFWHELLKKKKDQVEYGINVDRSAFSTSPADLLASSDWNLTALPKHSKCLLRHLVMHAIKGVTEPMLYIGMLFGTFAWHVEDNYLYSINYHHCGAPKTWYGVPGKHANLFEEITENVVFKSQNFSQGTSHKTNAAGILAQKTTMFSPNVLLQNGIDVYKASQSAGEYIITFPRAYHSGFSNGFNVGEAVNFAPYDWLKFGMLASTNYTRLNITPIISCDELVHKESMMFGDAAGLTSSQREIAVSFTLAVHIHHIVRWCLWKLSDNDGGQDLQIVQKGAEVIYCDECQRDCYCSYITHEENATPVCIFHDWKKYKNCTVHVHEHISEMEEKAKMFLNDEEVSNKELASIAQLTNAENFRIMKLMMKGGYQLFCKIKE